MKILAFLFTLFLLISGCSKTPIEVPLQEAIEIPINEENSASVIVNKSSIEESKLHSSVEYNVRQIVVRNEEDAEQIISQLNDGANFLELANKKSTATSNAFWFNPDMINKSFADATAQLEKGSYTKEAVQTLLHSWHVILLEDTRQIGQ